VRRHGIAGDDFIEDQAENAVLAVISAQALEVADWRQESTPAEPDMARRSPLRYFPHRGQRKPVFSRWSANSAPCLGQATGRHLRSKIQRYAAGESTPGNLHAKGPCGYVTIAADGNTAKAYARDNPARGRIRRVRVPSTRAPLIKQSDLHGPVIDRLRTRSW